MNSFDEKNPVSISGILIAVVLAAIAFAVVPGALTFVFGSSQTSWPIFTLVLLLASLQGFYIVQPNTARVLTLLGRYVGTDQKQGLRWTLPFLIARLEVSQRLRNFESATSKVNDAAGNPIEIAGVIVWRVNSPANSVFGVEDVADYVAMQGEAAIRALANAYPYGGAGQEAAATLTLQSNPNEIGDVLKGDMSSRVDAVGVEVIDARLSHLAYAPEIAAAMLQRQQADALLDAREIIVDGAVGIVGMALEQLESKDVVQLSDAQKAALVSNLLVVLSGDRTPQPVIQTGAPSD